MLLNPFTTPTPTIPGTRILEDALGLPGYSVQDPREPWRVWTIQWLYAPLPRRALGGIRAKLIDQQQCVTFCNQRDLEVMLGLGVPGAKCRWTSEPYPAPDECEWIGFCMDYQDLLDDLFERELRLRNGTMQILPSHTEITRRLHLEERYDAEELVTLLHDVDPETGISPDVRFETLERRWVSIEKTPLEWG